MNLSFKFWAKRVLAGSDRICDLLNLPAMIPIGSICQLLQIFCVAELSATNTAYRIQLKKKRNKAFLRYGVFCPTRAVKEK